MAIVRLSMPPAGVPRDLAPIGGQAHPAPPDRASIPPGEAQREDIAEQREVRLPASGTTVSAASTRSTKPALKWSFLALGLAVAGYALGASAARVVLGLCGRRRGSPWSHPWS